MPENTTETTTTKRDRTDDEIYVDCARREYETVAGKLESLAARIREQSQYVGTGRTSAVHRAAEMVNDFTNGVGNLGTFLWGVVHAAEVLDDFRRKAAARAGLPSDARDRIGQVLTGFNAPGTREIADAIMVALAAESNEVSR